MRVTIRQRRTLNFVLTAALLLGQMAGFLALPRTAEAALNADTNEEIIYLDDNGFIRVLDTAGDTLIQWFSPDGSWDHITLLDVQNDGDLEILAMDAQGDRNIRVTLFDPVLATGATDLSKVINGVPWDTLWTTSFGGNAQYVVGGNFDPNIAGDEIALGFNNGSTSIVEIYNANSVDPNTQRPSGRDWKLHIRKEYKDVRYQAGFSGQFYQDGGDELILLDSDSDTARLDIYRADQDMLEVDTRDSNSDIYKYAAVGQLEEGGDEEFALILSVDADGKDNLRTYEISDEGEISRLDDIDGDWDFNPQPEAVFLADIQGNGDDEVFFLRNYPSGTSGARLIMRDEFGDDRRQNEDLIEWNLMDDGADNQFRAGAGGDVDGDGEDEIILMRNDRIRIYPTPKNGRESKDNFVDYRFDTDNSRTNLLVGDLDRSGYTVGPVLLVSGNLIEAVVPAGTVSEDFSVSVTNVGTPGGVGINAIVGGIASWAEINPTFGTTPVSFRVRFNATSLSPGTYNTTLTLRANQTNVQNDNYVVYLNLTVIPPVLEPSPPILNIFRLPCETDPCSDTEIAQRNAPFTTTVRVEGSDSLTFRAAIIGVPAAPDGTMAAASSTNFGQITGGEVDDNGHIVVYDDAGNSRTLDNEIVSAAATLSTTIMVDPALTWVTSATVDSNIVPANISMVISPTVLTEEFQREYAVLVLVADTQAGIPSRNVVLVPIQLANIGDIMWVSFLKKE